MQVRVLGSAAGGGFPQWNCNCSQCAGYRSGQINAQSRTQSSIAISENGVDWILVNASPDIRQQLMENPELQPARAKRDSGIAAIILMDSQIDHTTGLLSLRENSAPLKIYSTEMVRQDLTSGFPIFTMLEHYCGVDHCEIPIDESPFKVEGFDNIELLPIPLSSKAPPYSPHRHDPHLGDNIGLLIHDLTHDKKVFYAPGLGVLQEFLVPMMSLADVLLVDGTTWRNDEMSFAGVGDKLASEMGHLPQSGKGGMIEQLAEFPKARKILIHINNTNPILNDNSPERSQLKDHDIEVAYDGMNIKFG